MNNPDQVLSSYKRHREAFAKASQSNKAAVFDALAAAKVTHVRIDFDGEGDSGAITEVAAYRGEEQIELPAIALNLQRVSSNDTEVKIAKEKLPAAIETLCYDYLEETNRGWENNGGAYGEFRLDVAARTVELEFNARYTDVFTENHTF